MTATDTPPAASADAGRAEAVPETEAGVAAPPPEPAGLAGWLTTSDHKRLGRLWIVTALGFLLVGGVAGELLAVERIDTGLSLLGEGIFGQVYTFHGEVAVFGFLVPFFVGLATYLVPLQVGSSDIALPRASATAYWTYLVSGGLLLAAYAADGGASGGSSVGVDLYLLSLIALNAATLLAVASVITTAIALRAPGMTMERTPLFTWSAMVGGGLTLLTAPVLMARLVELYVAHHFGGDFGPYTRIDWFWAVPQVYVLAVPAVGVVLEVVPTFARARLRQRRAGIAVVVASGVLGFGAFAQVGEHLDDLLPVGLALAAVLPALALLGLLADVVHRGERARAAPLLMGLGAALSLVLGALAGAAGKLSVFDLEGTVWEPAQAHLTLLGGAGLAALAALWFWAPKIWGVELAEGAGKLAFALVFWSTLVLAATDLASGLVGDQAAGAVAVDDEGPALVVRAASAAGGALAGLGFVVVVLALAAAMARRRPRACAEDPWGGEGLEWATASPPPPSNFSDALPVLAPAGPAAEEDGADEAGAGP